MPAVGGKQIWSRGRATAASALLVAAVGLVGCSSGGSDAAPTTVADAASSTSTGASPSSAPVASTDAAPGATTTTTTGFEDASDADRSAPATGSGIALLRAVRVGRNTGFERIVFEFEGRVRPGYRIGWSDGVVTEDGSGDTVTVAGSQHLEIVMEQASGFDMDTSKPSYTGPDRIQVTKQTRLLRDLVRTGDFESVLTWVAGSPKRVPYRVLSLTSPTRLVVDLQTS